MKISKIITMLGVLFLCACESNIDQGQGSQDGQGGSFARFALQGDYLYTVDQSKLNVFSIIDPETPIKVNAINVGFGIETLFGYKNYLYIGSRTGMFIYDIQNPEFPERLSSVEHFTACDPVVANETHAFVTLHNDTGCGGDVNVLEIYDVTDVRSPVFVNRRELSYPKGLGLYGNFLFVCDDEIKVFDVSNPENAVLVNAINKEAFDVIIQNNRLIAIGETGLFQYGLNPSNIEDVELLSSISL